MENSNRFLNRLSSEKSPYLLQHAANPVDWYPWCDEAFNKARSEDKPVFLSIGYSTCHWCHVMAHESFEDPDVAALLNNAFVCIKVDREERPDIDAAYMALCQMMTGSGGWPLTIIMTPDKKPFFAATYIPKETRFGRTGMLEIIPRIQELWLFHREYILQDAQNIISRTHEYSRTEPGNALDASILRSSYQHLRNIFDVRDGGFGSVPKFPTPHNLLFLLRYHKRSPRSKALLMVETTLWKMRAGGIYDHVGFGFHRYSTDPFWLVPHFEKMLYDQALLCMAYTEAYQVTGKQIYLQTAEEIISYVFRDMTSPDGAFYSAEDADSEGKEGGFYLWRADDIERILGQEDATYFRQLFHINKRGNFHDETTGARTGLNIPHLTDSGLEAVHNDPRVRTILKKLFIQREKRVHPHKDDKILTDWNGLMIAALAKAGKAMSEKKYIFAAEAAALFILHNLSTPDGRLLHRYRDNHAAIPGQAADYAFFIWGLIELYEATFNLDYLIAARDLTEQMLRHFWDAQDGGFFTVADDVEQLILRQKDIYDGAIPSANAVACYNLLRLSRIFGSSEYEAKAASVIRAFSQQIRLHPAAHTMMMIAQDFAVGPSAEVVIVGREDDREAQLMLAAVNKRYLPNVVVLFKPEDSRGSLVDGLCGFTKDLKPRAGSAIAYVCRNNVCNAPTGDVDEMISLLQ